MDLTRDLAASYLLVVLLPATSAGLRQVLKFSFHWRMLSAVRKPGVRSRILIAFGYRLAPFSIEANRPADAASYHLEVHAPSGLECAGLKLPGDGVAAGSEQPDAVVDVVAHAVGSYPNNPAGVAAAELLVVVPAAGLQMLAAFVCLFTAVIFGLEQLLPGAQATLAGDTGGSVAILLAAPAIVLALLSRPDENAIASMLLFPLRVVILGCAALLGAGAASFVGRLQQPYFEILWLSGAIVSAGCALALWLAILIRPSTTE